MIQMILQIRPRKRWPATDPSLVDWMSRCSGAMTEGCRDRAMLSDRRRGLAAWATAGADELKMWWIQDVDKCGTS